VAIEDSTDSEVFEAYVEEFLAPTLEEGQVVVLDKLGTHRRTERVRELLEGGERICSSYLPTLRTSTR
jgi:transposase